MSRIEKALAATPGVASAGVHFNTGRIEVEHDAVQAPVAEPVGAVRAAGYEARPAAF